MTILASDGFEYEVKIRLHLTRREIERIIELGVKHYDGVCKASCLVGGFVYGWANRLMIDEAEVIVVTATSREIGILGKIGESEQFERDKDKILGLNFRCHELLAMISEKHFELNK